MLSEGFWDDIWGEVPFSRYYGIEQYLALSRRVNRLFRRFMPRGGNVLELGCARAKQLIYFAKQGYQVFGLDYSQGGVNVANANLKTAGVKGEVRCEDIFRTSFEEGSFDVVYSMGLVEHFIRPQEIVDIHLRLLKVGGIVIVTVPNFNDSAYMKMARITGMKKAIIATHNMDALKKEMWTLYAADRKLEVLFLDYFGCLDFTLSLGHIKHRWLLYALLACNQALGYLTWPMSNSRFWSPYLVMIARKK